MQTTNVQEIQDLYKKCGVTAQGIGMVRSEINKGNLNNHLNTNFSNIYGKGNTCNFSNMTIEKQ